MTTTEAERLYELEKAKRWRVANRYTRKALSDLTGFSDSSIADFETGFINGNRRRPVSAAAMHRYKLCVAAIANGLQGWDWENGK